MRVKKKVIIKKINIVLSIILLFGLFSSFKYSKKVLALNEFSQYTTIQNGELNLNNKSLQFNSSLSVNLVSPSPNPTTAKIGDVLDVKYDINTISSGMAVEVPKDSIDEVIFLVDISKKMKDCQRDSYLQNGVPNQIINGDNIDHNKSLKMGLIAMGDEPILVRSNDGRENTYNNKNLLNVDNTSGNEKETFRLRVLEIYNKIRNTNNIEKPNVEASLETADKIFQEEGENNKNKAIVIVTSNDFICDEEVIKSIKNHGYKIIILDIIKDKDQNNKCENDKDSNEHYNHQIENLKKMYNNLGGYGDNYISGTFMDNQNYNRADDDLKKVANSISNGFWNKPYTLSDIKLNFDLGEGFSAVDNSGLQKDESLEGNRYKITIPDIKFNCEILENPIKKDSQKVKVKYTPDSTNKTIEFKVKFEKYNSSYKAIFGTSETTELNNNISYLDIDGVERKQPIETPIISGDFIPEVDVALKSSEPMFKGENPKIIDSTLEKTINLSYEISPKPITDDINKEISQDVVVVFDRRGSNSGQEFEKTRNAFNENIVNKLMNNSNFNLCILAFDSNGAYENITHGLSKDKSFVQNKLNDIKSDASNTPIQIDDCINEAIGILKSKESNGFKKSIVIVTFRDILYPDEINTGEKYNIFTLDVSKFKNPQTNNVKILYKMLSGDKSLTNYISNSGNNGTTEFLSMFGKFGGRIEEELINTYKIDDAVLTFDLNNYFELIRGAINDTNNPNLISISIPEIIYNVRVENNKRIYEADSKNINFQIKPISNNELDELSFGDSKIQYKNINNSIETPVIKLINLTNPINITHGIYMGIANGENNMIDTTEKTFPKGSAITFGAYFNGVSNGQIITLNLDEELNLDERLNDIQNLNSKIYAIKDDNKLEDLGMLSQQRNNSNKIYSGTILNLPDGCKKVLVIYTLVISEEDGTYTNNISVYNSEDGADATVEIGSELPDLF